jgi:hypothetical protein
MRKCLPTTPSLPARDGDRGPAVGLRPEQDDLPPYKICCNFVVRTDQQEIRGSLSSWNGHGAGRLAIPMPSRRHARPVWRWTSVLPSAAIHGRMDPGLRRAPRGSVMTVSIIRIQELREGFTASGSSGALVRAAGGAPDGTRPPIARRVNEPNVCHDLGRSGTPDSGGPGRGGRRHRRGGISRARHRRHGVRMRGSSRCRRPSVAMCRSTASNGYQAPRRTFGMDFLVLPVC